jgi:hypothetical protein
MRNSRPSSPGAECCGRATFLIPNSQLSEYDAGMAKRSESPGPTDPDAGIWQGKSVARVAESPDGMTVLVGRGARDNDILSIKLAAPGDYWFHVAGESGSHVVVRNPEKLGSLPRETKRFAASLAAGYSKARRGGSVAVHMARAGDVTKSRGFGPGKVQLRRFTTVHAKPLRLDEEDDS